MKITIRNYVFDIYDFVSVGVSTEIAQAYKNIESGELTQEECGLLSIESMIESVDGNETKSYISKILRYKLSTEEFEQVSTPITDIIQELSKKKNSGDTSTKPLAEKSEKN